MAELQTLVHKAVIPLAASESIGDFTSKLREAVVKSARSKMTVSKKDDVHPVEIFGDSVIVNLYKSYDTSPDLTYEERNKYYQIDYKRDASGAFTFGESAVEVERVTRYEPKNDLATSVSKSMPAPEEIAEVSKASWKKVDLFRGVILR